MGTREILWIAGHLGWTHGKIRNEVAVHDVHMIKIGLFIDGKDTVPDIQSIHAHERGREFHKRETLLLTKAMYQLILDNLCLGEIAEGGKI